MHKHVKSRPKILKLDSLNISLSSWFWIFLKWSYMWMNNWFKILAFFLKHYVCYGLAWNGAVWFGCVWIGLVRYFMVWFGMVLFCFLFGFVLFGMVWFEITSIQNYCESFIKIQLVLAVLEKIYSWFSLVCFGLVWFGMVWYGLRQHPSKATVKISSKSDLFWLI